MMQDPIGVYKMGSRHQQQRKNASRAFKPDGDGAVMEDGRREGRAARREGSRVARFRGWFAGERGRMARMADWLGRRVSWGRGAGERGRRTPDILGQADEISYAGPGVYSVRSQSQPGLYDSVGLDGRGRRVCDCPDHAHRKSQCKHILAVTAHVVDGAAARGAPGGGDGGSVVHVYPVSETVPEKCRHCPSTSMIKYGHQIWGGGAKAERRYQCRSCKRAFVCRAGAELMRCTADDVSCMLDCYFKGVPMSQIMDTLEARGLARRPSSVLRAIGKYVALIDAYASGLPLGLLGDRFHGDELLERIRGADHYCFGIMDRRTRLILAMLVVVGGGTERTDSTRRAC
ncbi:MAG: hypothetical protein OXP12_06030 [Thaumarchaeota archaeon]|nr:hypothetical protein [Nitrososphaerota archaeon]